MMRTAVRKTNPDFMTGVPELVVLRLLSEREMYGYEIVQAIGAASDAEIVLSEGVVYPTLHGLEAQGFLKSRRKTVNGRTRVYYATTAAGQKRLGAMVNSWRRINDAVAQIVAGDKHAAV